ncbi:MAG: hypothetical protein HY758_03775 [Nitrospirae bacterium]|nr:hypothetical protein [Nitrospirota bacterium]
MKLIKAIIFIAVLSLFAMSPALAKDDIQITLIPDKDKYEEGDPILLKYQILWLGSEDAQIYFSRTAFPPLEILYLNRWPLELNDDSPIATQSVPSRHEIRLFAPTMLGDSEAFFINSSQQPLNFFNGKQGYYSLDKNGRYVIRAKFDLNNPWKISNKQKATLWSNAIVLEIVPRGAKK